MNKELINKNEKAIENNKKAIKEYDANYQTVFNERLSLERCYQEKEKEQANTRIFFENAESKNDSNEIVDLNLLTNTGIEENKNELKISSSVDEHFTTIKNELQKAMLLKDEIMTFWNDQKRNANKIMGDLKKENVKAKEDIEELQK